MSGCLKTSGEWSVLTISASGHDVNNTQGSAEWSIWLLLSSFLCPLTESLTNIYPAAGKLALAENNFTDLLSLSRCLLLLLNVIALFTLCHSILLQTLNETLRHHSSRDNITFLFVRSLTTCFRDTKSVSRLSPCVCCAGCSESETGDGVTPPHAASVSGSNDAVTAARPSLSQSAKYQFWFGMLA